MRHSNRGQFSQQMNLLRRQIAQTDGWPLAEVLSHDLVAEVLAKVGLVWTNCVYTPVTTLLVFLWQTMASDPSCRNAVAKLVAHRVANGQRKCSSATGAYCTARKMLPEQFFHTLARETGVRLDRGAKRDWLWKQRRVRVFDGSTVSMPDTQANQQEYPQHGKQKPGVGFPIARIAAVFSLSCGAVLDWAICPYRGKGNSELGLLRSLLHAFSAGDVMLSDRYLCSWHELALLCSRQVDFVARMHQARNRDFRRGQRLGTTDHVVSWKKPKRPFWMSEEQYAALPDVLTVREIRIQFRVPGFRVEQLDIVTSLLSCEAFSRKELADLYRQRWHAELDLRSLKQTLQMDVLRCKTPELVRKEISMHMLASNLVRTVMAQAAMVHNLEPRTISFKGTVQTMLAFAPHREASSRSDHLHAELLVALATHRVGNRPNRYEPRKRKRRPKAYPLLCIPRQEAKVAMCRNGLR